MLQYIIKSKVSLKYIFLGIFVIYVTITVNLLSWISKNHHPERKIESELINRKDTIQENGGSQEITDSERQEPEINADIDSHSIIENSMKRKRKILAELIQEYQHSQEVPHKSELSFQSIGNISVFSAFYDDRLNLDLGAAVVRILGIARLDSPETLVCRYTDKGVDSWVLATKYEMCENHDRTYGGFVYMCNAPRDLEFVPSKVYVQSLNNLNSDSNNSTNRSVSLDLIQVKRKLTMKALEQNNDYGFEDNFYQSDDNDDLDGENTDTATTADNGNIPKHALNTSKLISTKDNVDGYNTTAGPLETSSNVHKRKLLSYDMQIDQSNSSTGDNYKIAVCVPPLFGDVKLSNFIQFVEFHRLQKVDHFFFYTMNITSDLAKILKYYAEEKVATIIDWTLPHGIEGKIWYNGQIVAIQDCLYRTIGHYDYAAFLDIDEVIVPKQDSDWLKLIQRLRIEFPETESGLTGGYSIKSAFFDPEKTRDNLIDSPRRLKLTFLEMTERHGTISSVRTKLIIQPEFIIEMGIHHVSQTLNMLFNVTVSKVSPSLALIHHFRSCTTVSDKRMACGGSYVTDMSILKFEERLVTNYMDVVKRNMKYFKHASIKNLRKR